MSFKGLLVVIAATLCAFCCIPPSAIGQGMTTGGIRGTITDPKNAPVPNATVSLKNNAKGTTQQTATNGRGEYQFALLDPGSYTVTVYANGFQVQAKIVTVSPGQPAAVDFRLSVQVRLPVQTQRPSLVQTTNGDVSVTVDRQQATQVPNPGNDLTYPVQYTPGAIMNTEHGTGNFSLYGMPATSNRFILDGMDDNEVFSNVNNNGPTNLLLGTNEIQDVNIIANGYTGTFGEYAGSNISYVTESGGNQLHGNATYYWNGRALNANNFFNNMNNVGRPFDNANQWQGSLGGPLKKNKLFFFVNTEGMRVFIPTTAQVVIPSPQFQTAVITNLQQSGQAAAAAFFSGMFSTLNSAPQANTAIDNQLPGRTTVNGVPNVPTGDGCGAFNQNPQFFGPAALPCAFGFTSTQSNLTTEYTFSARFDLDLNSRNRMFLRFERVGGTQATYSDPISSTFNVRSSQPFDGGQFQWTHLIGATAINQFDLNGYWNSAILGGKLASGISTFQTTLGLADGTFFNTAGPNLCSEPPVGPGFPLLLGGEDCVLPQGHNAAQAEISDNLSKTTGASTFRIGGEFRRVNTNDQNFGLLHTGLLVINTINDFYNGGSTGDSLTQSFPQSLEEPISFFNAGGYIEDDWRYSKRLSFTLALRVEHDSNPSCRNLCFARFNTPFGQELAAVRNGATPNFAQVPYNQAISINQRYAFQSLSNVLPEPRIGFAWQPFANSDKTVVRGGAGLFYSMYPLSVADRFAENPPFNATFVGTNDFVVAATPGNTNAGSSIFADVNTLNTAFQNGFFTGERLQDIQASNPGFRPPNLFTAENATKIPQYQKWSLELQHQLDPSTIVTLSYVGNHGVHEWVINNSVNGFGFGPPPGGIGTTPTNPSGLISNTGGVDPRFTGVSILAAAGTSKYNGATASVSHQLTSRGWGTGIVQASYTYSHASDDVSNGGFSQFSSTSLLNPQDPYNIAGSYGASDYDARHSANLNFVWGLPVRELVGKRASSYWAEGWQLSGAFFYRSGFPYSVVDGALDASLAENNNYFAEVMPQFLPGKDRVDCRVASSGPQCLGNPALQFPSAGSEPGFFTGQRNIFRGPHFINFDTALMKETRLPFWEGARISLGVEAFNVLNHPNFGLPVNNLASPNFGAILTTAGSPTGILGAALGGDTSPRMLQFKAEFRF